MIAGVRGRLITASFVETELPLLTGDGAPPRDAVRALEEWSARREATFGPASSVRSIADGIAVPLLRVLGFSISRRVDRLDGTRFDAGLHGRALVPVTVLGWDS